MIRPRAYLAALLVASTAGAAAGETTPHPAPLHDALECGEAAGVLSGEPPGAVRDLMARIYRADGCAGLLATEQGVTPATEGAPGLGCREAAAALGSTRAFERRRAAYLYRRTCVEGATGMTWEPATRTPAAAR